jgi:hypothetical protein
MTVHDRQAVNIAQEVMPIHGVRWNQKAFF